MYDPSGLHRGISPAQFKLDCGLGHPAEHRLRLNPETDTVEVRVDEDLANSPNELIAPECLVAFLYDSWAHDPKGVGVCRLVMGRYHAIWDARAEGLLERLCRWYEARMETTHDDGYDYPPEVTRGLQQYFTGFANPQTHRFYAALAIPLATARQARYVNLEWPQAATQWMGLTREGKKPVLRRAVPIVPHGHAIRGGGSQVVEVAALLEQDPRPIERDQAGDGAMLVTADRFPSYDHPLRVAYHWLQVLSCFNVPAKQAIKGVRYMVGTWPIDHKEPSIQSQHTRKGVVDRLRRWDDEWIHYLSKERPPGPTTSFVPFQPFTGPPVTRYLPQYQYDPSEPYTGGLPNQPNVFGSAPFLAHALPGQVNPPGYLSVEESGGGMAEIAHEYERMLATDTGVQEVAGVWIFESDALGEIPDNRQSLPRNEVRFNLAEHKPALMVFDLE